MKKILLLISVLLLQSIVFAQKNLRLVVYQVDAGTHDCDGFGAGDSDWVISWDGGSIDEQCHGFPESDNPSIANVSYTIFNTTYDCAASWPSGNLSYTLYGDEADGLEGDCSHDYSTSQSWGYPSTTNGNTNLNGGNWISLTVNECNNSDFVRYRARWQVSGSFIPVASNNNICSATNFGTTNQNYTSAWQNFNNDCATLQSGEPSNDDPYNTVWYRFTTPATGLVSATGSLEGVSSFDNTVLNLYRSSGGCGFGSLTYIDGDYDCAGNNDIDISANCLLPNTTYYWQMGTTDCTTDNGETGNYRFRMSTSAYGAGPDNLCNATSMGTINGLTGSLALYNQSNECASTQSGEFGGGQNTVWYTFTTGSTVGYDFNINMDAISNGLNSDIYVYEVCGNACSGSTANWGNLTEVDNFFDVNPLPGEFDAGGTISGQIKPNTTYYIRADGTTAVGTTGGFHITMNFSGGAYVSNDNLCNAQTISTLAPGNSSTTNGTITRSSSEDICSLNEPDQDSDETTVWYKYTVGATIGQFVSFDVDFGFGCLPDMNIYTASSTLSGCPFTSTTNGFSQLTFVADGGLDGFHEIDCVPANTTYYIQVDEDGPCSGTFSLEVIHGPPTPVNDLPCNAIDIASQTFNNHNASVLAGQNNTNGTNCNEPNPGWTLDGNDQGIWYELHPTGQNLIIDANNTGSDDIDIQLALYEANATCSNLTYIDRDWLTGAFDEDFYVNCLDPTKDYYLLVDGGSDILGVQEGQFDLNIYYPREGGRDLCPYSTSNWDGTPFIGTVPNGGSFTYRNLANLCGFDGTYLTGTLGLPAANFTVDKGVLFSFRPPASGSVKINADSDPVLGGLLGLGGGDEINLEMMIYESFDGSCSPSSWSVVNYESYSDGISFNEEMIVNCLDPTKDYWLLVDGETNTQGYFDITMEDYGVTTPNDLACDAIAFTTNTTQLNNWNTCNSNVTITLNGQNNYCGNNINEPAPSDWTPLPATSQPVWYTFVAPPSGKLEIRLNTTTSLPWKEEYINGKLAVYDLPNGENICTYQFLSSDEITSDYDLDFPPASTGEDMEIECLTPGRTYYVMVDGKETIAFPEWFRGEFSLEFESDPRDSPAPNDSICEAKPLGDPTGGTVGTNVNDASLLNSPPRNPSIVGYCMRAENSFCAGTADDPSLNGFTLWSYDNTVWYSFVGPVSGSVRIDVDGNLGIDGDEFAPQVVVYESSDGTCNGTLYDLQATPTISSGFSTSATMDVNCLNTGQTYFIVVDGGPLVTELGDINGYFEVEVSEITPTEFPPSHNDICDAKIIDPFSSLVSISNDTNRCSNREFSIPEPSTFTRDRTVWYSFTTPNGAGPYAVEIDVTSQLGFPFGDAVDPQIAVYRSSNNLCGGTIVEEFSDYSALGLPLSENAEVHCLDPNTTYWIMVDGSAINTQGFFDITVESITPHPVAVNNNICDLVDLGTLGATSGNSIGAGTDYNNFCTDTETGEFVPNAFGIDQTVWFRFTTPTLASPSDGVNVDFSVFNDPNSLGDQIDLQIALYQSSDGTCTGTLNEIESSYNPLGFSESIDDVCLKQNTNYYIQVDGGINVQGYFTINIENDGVSARPVNDDFLDAINLTIGTATSGNNNCATVENGEPHAGTDIQKSVWYKFIAPASGRVEIRTADTDGLFGLDPEWYLYELDGANYIELANDYTPLFDDVEDYDCLFPGQEYYLQVDGTTLIGPEGTFDITVTDLDATYVSTTEPANNHCDDAVSLIVQTESCHYSTGIWNPENYGEPTRTVEDVNACGQNCGEIWYKFIMPSTGFVKIEGDDDFGLAGTANSEMVAIAYRGTCASMTMIECGIGGLTDDVDYSITGTPGETIYLQVFDDASNDRDFNENFAICISERCAADDCLDALAAPDILGQGPQCFDVRDATGEDISGGDPGYGVAGVPGDNPSNSVYFSFSTDDFCWGYILNFITTDVGNSGILGNPELIFTIYEDDGTPCNHGAGEPSLDNQTFDLSTYPSGVNYSINYSLGAGVNNIKPNTRYIIQVEGNSSTVDGTIEISKICEGREWAYPTAANTSSTDYCFVDGWRHYYNDGGTVADASDDILIFSVRPNGNVFDGIATIHLDAAPGFAETAGVEASWTMRRYWDFDVSSGAIANPVDVKFYYEASEKIEIINLAQTYATNNSLLYEEFEWFKSVDGVDFDPGVHVTPPIVLAGYGSGSGLTITGSSVTQTTGVGVTLVCEDYEADNLNEFCNGVHYVEYNGLTGFSGGTGASGASLFTGSPLPIELVTFEGENVEGVNVIKWITATEINNSHFELLHSANGVVFKVIAEIDGAGNSNSVLSYSYDHKSFSNGINFYQLRNIDFDGTSYLSDVISINNVERKDENMLLLLYPNPSSASVINIDAYIVRAGLYNIEVRNLVGKLIFVEKHSLTKGNNTIKVNFENYSAGPYIVDVIDPVTGKHFKKKYIRTR